ncbi:PorP/SprF family type IX secretion system membrane protein [Flaviaesturariibacter aridisoli]|uniref:Type IX secretion system membrane protein PorP/SprF n=1 Tax=Flaviaesturariibacter aridisoli TaxID=2545761 RepID=A0A4R4E1N5_9BACT|nr:PorP/SprF family type IX secretion system membrane protein [Flaviaesturariibacter aridisoli]TCZ68650.1 type IX secretion system membrane protein PorP/SprF [Flaviaesturariibacter aridisoli]
MNTFHKLCTAWAVCLLGGTLQAQDLHFSQFFQAPLLRNPALAGIFTGDIRVQALYRDQWNSVTNAYRTTSLSGEYKMPIGKADDFLTLGAQVLYDQAGTVSWKTTHVLPTVNYHKSLSTEVNRYLSVGFMGGVVQTRIDRDKVQTSDWYNGAGDGESFTGPKATYLDMATGISFNTQWREKSDDNLFLAVAYHHFNRPKRSFYQDASAELKPKIVISGGIRFSVTEASYLNLQGDFSKQGQYQESVLGALYGIKMGPELDNPRYTLHGGAFLRWNDAVVPVIKVDYHPFSFSFSYDVNISKLKTSTLGAGGFEVGLTYTAKNKRREEMKGVIFCPKY